MQYVDPVNISTGTFLGLRDQINHPVRNGSQIDNGRYAGANLGRTRSQLRELEAVSSLDSMALCERIMPV